jgi:hypothetical protein
LRLAVMDGSFCRNDPAPEFLGLTKSRPPASAWRALSASNSSIGM